MERTALIEATAPKSNRIYIECPVVTPGPILTLQKDLGLIQSDRIPANKLHLTLFHLGKPDELFDEIGAQNPDIHSAHFAYELSRVLKGTLVHDEEIETTGKELGLYEQNSKPVIVIRLEDNEKIRELRGEFLARFEEFLAACGIKDIPGYMQTSPNLRYQTQESYDPHISICFPSVNVLPTIDVSELSIVLGSPRLANIEF